MKKQISFNDLNGWLKFAYLVTMAGVIYGFIIGFLSALGA